jgi:hypothetical protein
VRLNRRPRPPSVLKVLVGPSSRAAPAAQPPRRSPPWSPSTLATGRETSSVWPSRRLIRPGQGSGEFTTNVMYVTVLEVSGLEFDEILVDGHFAIG